MTSISVADSKNRGRGRLIAFFAAMAIGVFLWYLPAPPALDPKAWKIFAIFIYTLLGMIFRPFDAGVMTLSGVLILLLTGTLTFEEGFSGFSHPTVWLIVFAFFIARGFIKTGFGFRLSYQLMSLLGTNTLGMAYGMVFTDCLLSSAIPSVTARTGGILYPIVSALSETFESRPGASRKRMGAYLVQTVFQCSAVTSAMFLTGMSGNPMVQSFARSVGVEISWGLWMLAALVPGLISLLAIPYLIYRLYPPEITHTPKAKAYAEKQLQLLGPITRSEKIMMALFGLMIALWIFAGTLGIHPTVTALLGLMILIGTDILSWEDILGEKSAWNTLIWFASLSSIATSMGEYGLMTWCGEALGGYMHGLSWQVGFPIAVLLYFYAHYFFASNIAHIATMYTPFLLLSIMLGTPPIMAALVLGFCSNLFGALTTYGSGPAPIYFGSGYVTVGEWWGIGLWVSLVNLFIWLVFGTLWWFFLGLL